ncbi:M28 family peptidase [Chitinophaga arvensicola]|uniref:Peptidase family M28 n=1 Tax=Chitinophaga arvensicola TaxID=29529 RepID=A0A1I0NTY7_9BACT|nr:M28 family peptidase [Chitinophaga arvensicola]SEW05063.1 Peptidase family M28 [Chitinophaga arvensicola]
MRVSFVVICLFLVTRLHAQVNNTHAAKYGETITAAGLSRQLHVIAGPEMEGRETATRGQERAAAYIISQFSAAGLQPGVNGKWEQHYPLYSDSLLNSTITVGKNTYQFARDFLADLRAGNNQDLKVSRVYYAETVADYARLDVKGQVVMIRDGVKRGLYRSKGNLEERISIAKEKGAAAVLVISPAAGRYKSLEQQKLRSTGMYWQKDTTANPNIYYITPALAADILNTDKADNLLEEIDRGWKPPVVSNTAVRLLFNKAATILQPSNVLAYLEGTDKKNEIVFVTAHYDHLGKKDNEIFYGADDDGSGTSAVIEIAAAFARAKKAGNGPRRSMVFMTVSGEEKGLLGSQYYTEHPVYPLVNTVTDLNIDMIGRIDPAHEKDTNYLYIIGDNKLSSELRPINEKANDTYTHLKLDYKYNDPNDPEGFYYRSDHYMFAQHGIPIIFYFNGTHADYHAATDSVDKINFELLAKRARLVFYTAWDIANRDEKLVVDRHDR